MYCILEISVGCITAEVRDDSRDAQQEVSKIYRRITQHGSENTHPTQDYDALTSSILSLTQYLVITPSLVWPIRCTRSTACASAMGFQCGSFRCTSVAMLRSLLCL